MNNISVVLEKIDAHQSRVRVVVSGLSPVLSNGKVRYRRLRFTAGTIQTKDWDSLINRPSAAHSKKDGGVLHRSIDLLCLNVQRAYIESQPKTAEAVKERYEELIGRKRVEEPASTLLLEVARGWVAKREVADHTIHTYIGLVRKVEEYERSSRVRLDLGKVAAKDLIDFLRWVHQSYTLAPNTMASCQKLINKALNEVRQHGISTCPKVKLYAYSTPKKEVLDWADLERICRYQPKSRTEANAQTLCVAIALSSVRISDVWLHVLSIKKRSGVLCSEFIITKNSHRHPVSVSPIIFEPVRLLLERNGMPQHISEMHLRRSIKALVRAAGVEKNVEVHSLRRSFVSLFLSIGVVPDHLLARVFTGHQMAGERTIFHNYNHASMLTAQLTVIKLLQMVDSKQTSGLALLSPEVCPL
jgi:hypothetical protein